MHPEPFEAFVDLKDVSLSPYAVVAYGKLTVPATMQSPAYPAITLWLRDVREPIMITYISEEQRDEDIQKLRAAIDRAR